MRINNTTQRTIILSYSNGVVLPISAGSFITRPNTDVNLIDDTAVQLALFSTGALLLTNDDGSAYTGPALPAQPVPPPVPGVPLTGTRNPDGSFSLSGGTANAVRDAAIGAGARVQILNGATNGTASAWQRIAGFQEKFAYNLDSGNSQTGFLFELSEDGENVSVSSFPGTTNTTVTELSYPLTFFDTLAPALTVAAKFFRVRVISGAGAITMYRGV